MQKRYFEITKWERLLKKASLLPALLTLVVLIGCSTVGPSTISHGRADYNEAINRTDDEQLLMALVRGRYGETSRLLAVTGVTANVRFATNVGAEVGYSTEEIDEWTFGPFRGGVAYEENPTISYAPVQGEKYLRQIMSPVPLDILILALRSSAHPTELFTMLVKSVNGIKNPDFLKPPSGKPDLRFSRLVLILEELSDADIIHWVRGKQEGTDFNAVIRDYDPEFSERVIELLRMLGLSAPKDRTEDVVLPVNFALKGKESEGMAISTRSTMDLIEIMRASVEVPEDHVQSGIALSYPPLGLAGKGVHIRLAEERPINASVAVSYGGYWFFIDRADQRTKMAFRNLRTLWEISIASAAAQQPAPVLTLPVSR
jgi:hypothetical protein